MPDDLLKCIVTMVENRTVSGFFQVREDSEVQFQVTNNKQNVLFEIEYFSRTDMTPPPGYKLNGFKISTDFVILSKMLVSEQVTIFIQSGEWSGWATIGTRIRDAAVIEQIGPDRIISAMQILPDINTYLREADRLNGFWINVKSSKKEACVISQANFATGWFPYFYQYYKNLVGAKNIFIITNNSMEFNDYELGGVLLLGESEYDDGSRAIMISRMQQGMLAFYKWILICDVDEILLPVGAPPEEIFSSLDDGGKNPYFSIGIDVVQTADEPAFNFEKTVLEQRDIGFLQSTLSKPHVSSKPLWYSIGFHHCNYPLSLRLDLGFICLHLKWACREIRADLQNRISTVRFPDERIANYSFNSVNPDSKNPTYERLKSTPLQALDRDTLEEFSSKLYKTSHRNAVDGIWRTAQVSGNSLISLKSLNHVNAVVV